MDEHVSVPAATGGLPPQGQPMACTAYFGVMPPCIRGSVALPSVDGQVELEHLPDGDIPEQLIQHTSDEELSRHLCQVRAVFPFTVDGTIVHEVECLTSLASVAPAAQAAASIVVGIFRAEQSQSPTPLAVMTIALVRDTLLAAGLDKLRDACCRPRWRVPMADLKEWFLTPDSAVGSSPGSGLSLLCMGQSGQSCIT